MNAPTLRRLLLSSFLLVFAVACDSGTGSLSTEGGSSDTGDSDAVGCQGSQCDDDGGNGGREDTGSEDPEIVSIEIDPDEVELLAEDGAQPEHTFSVIAHYDDGSTSSFRGAEFSIDDERIGFIDEANGRFTAHGIVGGEAEVTAEALGVSVAPATATVRVHVRHTLVGSGLDPDVDQQFQGSQVDDPARRADIVYPLDGAVMPENVYPADIQWLNGAAGDIFQIRLNKPRAEVVAYLEHGGAGFGNHWLVDEDAWRTMAQTDADAPMGITVTRLEAASGDVISPEPVQMRFAPGTISGSVYYWDIAAGRIIRINDGTATRDQFMPTPPTANDGANCVGCHSVSNSGRYMVGRLGGGNNIGAVFDLTKDLTTSPPPTEFPLDDPDRRWWFSTWSADDSRLMVSVNEGGTAGELRLMDPFTGDWIDPASGALPASGTTHPSWSPDGSLVAYVANVDNWGGTNTAGDIATLPVTGPDSFGQPQVVRAGNDIPGAHPAGQATSYPTWSPDSQWLAFAHGTGSRSENMQAALYMMRKDGSDVVRLDNASGGVDAIDTFQPNFSPFETGEYFWLSYLSRRDYGNAEVGTRGVSRQQIWVSAVSTNPQPGQDPSEVGYWLPGQNPDSMNIAAYWAPRACRSDGDACSVGAECCSGECLPGDGGALVCSPPPPERCREVTETCSTHGDCCGDMFCASNVCYHPDG